MDYQWELSAKIINDAEKLRFIGILAYPKPKYLLNSSKGKLLLRQDTRAKKGV